MKIISGVLMSFMLMTIATTTVEAKRGAPKDVPPVPRDGVVYTAPHDRMGCVVAKDEKTGRQLWNKQVYIVKYDPALEQDVQDCFITALRFDAGKLIVENESGGQFELNPATLALKALKGAEIIDRTEKKKN